METLYRQNSKNLVPDHCNKASRSIGSDTLQVQFQSTIMRLVIIILLCEWFYLQFLKLQHLCSGSIPVKDTYLGYRLDPWPCSGCVKEATNRNQCVSLTLIYVSLPPFSLPAPAHPPPSLPPPSPPPP